MQRKHFLRIDRWRKFQPRPALWVLIGALLFSSIILKHQALASPDNVCLNGAAAQVNQVRYLGKNSNGDDQIKVEWMVQSITECIPFGSGLPVDDRVTVPPFGYELTVKI